MLTVKAKSGPSKIEGTGLFADQFIPKGTVVWKFLAGFDRVFPADYPESLPEPLKSWFKSAASFDDGLWTLAGDHAVLMNHSDEANVRLREGATNKGEADIVAARDIRKGEELTVRYWEFDAPSRERGGAAKGENMSSMKKYIDQFRVSAGLSPDDRVLTEAKLLADEKTRAMEKKMADALESNKGVWDSVGGGARGPMTFRGSYEEPPEYEDMEDQYFYNAFNPTVSLRKGEKGYSILCAFERTDEKRSGKVFRKKSALFATGMNPRLLSEARYDYDDDYDDRPSRGELEAEKWREVLEDAMQEAVQKMLDTELPKLIAKTFPDMKALHVADTAMYGDSADLIDENVVIYTQCLLEPK